MKYEAGDVIEIHCETRKNIWCEKCDDGGFEPKSKYYIEFWYSEKFEHLAFSTIGDCCIDKSKITDWAEENEIFKKIK